LIASSVSRRPLSWKPRSAPGAGVEGNFRANLVEFGLVGFDVLPGAEHALLLAGPQGEADGAARDQPVALIARAASMTRAALQPSSRAPVPRSQESRCAPRMTASSGFSYPRISPMDIELIDRAADICWAW
jgi:hypothetical protein